MIARLFRSLAEGVLSLLAIGFFWILVVEDNQKHFLTEHQQMILLGIIALCFLIRAVLFGGTR
jgi:hypothetical protein